MMNNGGVCGHCCIKVENLNVKFGDVEILRDINLHVNCKELIAVIGPNGAGKTTLLKSILGEIPFRGRIISQVAGKPVKRLKVGYVPQKINYDQDSPISVQDLVTAVVSMKPVWLGVSKKSASVARDILRKVRADHLAGRKIGELSGGEIQRIMLAIAMYPVPNLLLLDEPLANIDANGLTNFYDLVSELRSANDVAIIMVTHDLAGIAPHANRLVFIDHRVIAEGTKDDIDRDPGFRKKVNGILPGWRM